MHIEDPIVSPYLQRIAIAPFLRSNIPVNTFRDSKYTEWYVASRKNGKILLLDTNFWILLRRAQYEPVNSLEYKLYIQLLNLKNSKKILCPITPEVFFEVQKQEDPVTRYDTLALIDTFSDGFGLVSAWAQSDHECKVLARALRQESKEVTYVSPWRRGAILLMNSFVEIGEWHRSQIRGMQNWQFEAYSKVPFTIIDESLGPIGPEIFQEKFSAYLEKYSPIKKATSPTYGSFEQIRALEYSIPILVYFHRLNPAGMGGYGRQQGQNFKSEKQILKNFREVTPSHAAYTALTSLGRRDLKKNETVNDVYDLMIAATALATADYFFTEKHMSEQVERVREFEFGHRLKAAVSNVEQALEILQNI